jgi:hypothetical protein
MPKQLKQPATVGFRHRGYQVRHLNTLATTYAFHKVLLFVHYARSAALAARQRRRSTGSGTPLCGRPQPGRREVYAFSRGEVTG